MPDENLAALAGAIAGVPEEPKPEASVPPSEEKGKEPGEGVSPPPDGLASLDFSDPDKAVKTILEHPVLGKVIQRWADKAAVAQVRAARQQERESTTQQVEQEAAVQRLEEHFSGLSPQELAEELASDSRAATAYGQLQAHKASQASPQDAEQQARVYATASVMQAYMQLVAGLPEETQADLEPEKFAHLGDTAMTVWGEAIYKALVKTEVDKRWEAEKQNRLAELERARPDLMGGRRSSGSPDIMGTPSELLLEGALAQKEQQRKGG